MVSKNKLVALICFALAVLTLALYWPVTYHDFINLDDQQYITANAHVQAGITRAGIVWAFENTEADNWFPVTWISHMMDCQFFGLNAGKHHLMNVIFHTANVLLLFLLLNNLTNALWRSAFVAALFAFHPLHVESVAWAAERKDVLSAFFFLLTLICYAQFVARLKNQNSKSKKFYALALLTFALGLMSKPMLVTLPFVLLLLDFWPLQRFGSSTIQYLLLEKIPFFLFSAISCVVTYLVQRAGGATWSGGTLPFGERISNALISYTRYISKTFWPSDLAVIYPYQRHWPIIAVIGAAALLVVWTALVFFRARRQPYFLIGWLWFLGTLIPTIGLVQVGAAAMADRYTYIPSIGLFILIAWGLNDLFASRVDGKKIGGAIAIAAIVACCVVTHFQLQYWQNSLTLFEHTIRVTPDNYSACNFLGRELDKLGRTDDAIALYRESVRIAPNYPQAQYNLGMDLLAKNEPHEAVEPLAAAVRLAPDEPVAKYYLGIALMGDGKFSEAAAQFSEALRLKPDFDAARQGLNAALAQGKK